MCKRKESAPFPAATTTWKTVAEYGAQHTSRYRSHHILPVCLSPSLRAENRAHVVLSISNVPPQNEQTFAANCASTEKNKYLSISSDNSEHCRGIRRPTHVAHAASEVKRRHRCLQDMREYNQNGSQHLNGCAKTKAICRE